MPAAKHPAATEFALTTPVWRLPYGTHNLYAVQYTRGKQLHTVEVQVTDAGVVLGVTSKKTRVGARGPSKTQPLPLPADVPLAGLAVAAVHAYRKAAAPVPATTVTATWSEDGLTLTVVAERPAYTDPDVRGPSGRRLTHAAKSWTMVFDVEGDVTQDTDARSAKVRQAMEDVAEFAFYPGADAVTVREYTIATAW